MKARLLLLTLLTACAADAHTEGMGAAGARSIDVISPVKADQFVAPDAVGLSTEALTNSYFFINSENGAQINRSNSSWDGLRCWIMQTCTNLSTCTNHDYTCTFNIPGAPGNTRCVGPGLQNYYTLCGPNGCDVYQQGNPIRRGNFMYGSDASYVFRTGNATGWPYAACKLVSTGARLQLSTTPL